MSAGQESGSPIRENRTLLPAPLPPDEARGTLAAAAGVSTVGLRPPFDTPQRHSHPVCRAILTLIVALDNTFYWSKKAYATAYPDYHKAKLYHWLHGKAHTPDLSTTAGILESVKEP